MRFIRFKGRPDIPGEAYRFGVENTLHGGWWAIGEIRNLPEDLAEFMAAKHSFRGWFEDVTSLVEQKAHEGEEWAVELGKGSTFQVPGSGEGGNGTDSTLPVSPGTKPETESSGGNGTDSTQVVPPIEEQAEVAAQPEKPTEEPEKPMEEPKAAGSDQEPADSTDPETHTGENSEEAPAS